MGKFIGDFDSQCIDKYNTPKKYAFGSKVETFLSKERELEFPALDTARVWR